MIRRWLRTWEAVFLLAIVIGGTAAYVSAQMTGARLPLQGVGIWGYDPNLGSFFSVRVDQDGTLIVSHLPSGGIVSIVPGVGPSGFFLVSIIPGVGRSGAFLTSILPGFGSLDRFLVSQIGLGSVDTGRPILLVSLVLPPSLQGALGALLVSEVSAPAGGGGGGLSTVNQPARLTSEFFEPKNNLVASVLLIPGSSGNVVRIVQIKGTLTSLGSLAFYSNANQANLLMSSNVLYSERKGNYDQINLPMVGGSTTLPAHMCTANNDGFWAYVGGNLTNVFNVNILYSVAASC